MSRARSVFRAVPSQMTRRHPIGWLAGVSVACIFSLFLALQLDFFSADAKVAVDDISETIAPFVAASLCALAARRSRGRPRIAWSLISAALASWAVGQAIWTVQEVWLQRDVPVPSPSDPFFLAMIPLMLAGILLLSSARRTLGHVRTALDSLVMLLAIAAPVCSTIILPTWQSGDSGLAGTMVSVAYPAGDIMLLFAAFVALRRQGKGQARTIVSTFAAGVLLATGSDLGFAFMQLHGSYADVSLIYLGWPAGMMLIGLAAAMQASWQTNLAAEDVKSGSPVWRQLLPMLTGLALAGWLLFEAHQSDLHPGVALVVIAVGAVGVALLRQAVVLADNQGLTHELLNARHELERRVEERTAQLFASEDELRYQSFHDPLTGLANRSSLMGRLDEALARAARRETYAALLFFDLDNFKAVNDSRGHEVGDHLLQEVASRLSQALPSTDTVARFGGDEFVVLIEGGAEVAWATEEAEALRALVSEEVELEGKQIRPTVSVGVAIASEGNQTPQELLRQADEAMHAAKARGKDRVEVYDTAMHDAALNRLELLADLRVALPQDEFRLRFQPTVDVRANRLSGFEALIRWQHPRRGIISPDNFIPLAEESGLIVPIGAWVLREAVQSLQDWQARFPEPGPMKLNVNVSARQLFDPSFIDLVRDVLAESQFPPGQLVLEITESTVMKDVAVAAAALRKLRDLGVLLAVDDFGTGYSSPSYLREFPFSILKIDKSFVSPEAGPTEETIQLVRAVIQMSRSLHLQTVAEGIETPEQLERLRLEQCDFGQGYLFVKPLTPEEVERLLGGDVWLQDSAA
jgi:diguanylate cyclase (GGDEF)-like protein